MIVKKVSKVTVHNLPVYDLTVDGTENFCLASGIVVHNSKDVADAVCGAYNTLLNRADSWQMVGGDGRPDMEDRPDFDRR